MARLIELNEALSLQLIGVSHDRIDDGNAARFGRKHAVVAVHLHDEAVIRDGPKRAVVAVFEIMHGGFAAQPRKPGPPSVVLKQLRPADIDLFQTRRFRCRLLIR